MRPDFHCDPTAGHAPEEFLQRFRTRTNSLFQLYLTCLIHDAVPAVAIAQIQSDGQFLLRNIPTLRSRSDANLLHRRSPFYLCFEHVDNLGAYTASRSETALLISSVNINRQDVHDVGRRGTQSQEPSAETESPSRLRQGPTELTDSAMDAVHKWAYTPYLLNGEPVVVETDIRVTFKLD